MMINTGARGIAGLAVLSVAVLASEFYEFDRIDVIVPDRWSVQPAYQTSEGSRTSRHQIGITLVDGRFRLYLLTHYSQASGVKGGRFGEISKYVAPWVTSGEPASCFGAFDKKVHRVTKEISRVDLLLGRQKSVLLNDSACGELYSRSATAVWAGSYFGTSDNEGELPGFFLNFPLGTTTANPDQQMVFAATLQSNTIAELPMEADQGLLSFLKAADGVIRSIKYR